ncbi:hypothetical protein W97_01388 [Coniosporium apollinis CBS 100218]|uniref:PAN2-PAN3 deadenylation complex subunit PAN3 n=1 Tax=Coniosporium apollinis (strain CBS 100218) TaxID=1168221 RepID=R7YJW8_CONA1|nr:uncharacterized protein W97_01388 [Coniosporium apollinis CBS 100218]EON62168.1 hypothetical protein W97_01388 [Coniosporium apollinis CBS 100218]
METDAENTSEAQPNVTLCSNALTTDIDEPVSDNIQADPSVTAPVLNPYSSYNSSSTSLAAAGQQANPYAQDASSISGTAYYQNANALAQPPQYHLYFPLGPYRENLLAYQKIAHNFFIPDDLREELQRKAEAARQVLPNSALPEVEHYHTLVPLDTNNQRNVTLFGYPSWVYKAVSSKDGKTYILRRLENYRLTNEKAIRSVQSWKRINNGGVVKIHDAFTTRAFGDSSLIFVTDYFPRSKTLAQEHLNYTPSYNRGRPMTNQIPEATLWGYITQIASALKAIHSNGLAARVINLSKVIVTSKNRVRLNGCAILDVTQHDIPRPLQELQAEDLTQLGRLILCLANNNQNATLNIQKSLEHVGRTCSLQLKDCVTWLLTAAPAAPTTLQSPGGTNATPEKTIDTFLQAITTQIINTFDNTLHANDIIASALALELENGRLFRIVSKLNFITERPEFDHNPLWAETGERYYLKLFRDFLYHSVDAQGKPVTDLGHVIAALNKVDAGSEEKCMLVSRDEQNVLMVSYRDVKRMVESCFLELVKGGARR